VNLLKHVCAMLRRRVIADGSVYCAANVRNWSRMKPMYIPRCAVAARSIVTVIARSACLAIFPRRPFRLEITAATRERRRACGPRARRTSACSSTWPPMKETALPARQCVCACGSFGPD
ncbi:unnamed protein product, partial [Mycena citricolor]